MYGEYPFKQSDNTFSSYEKLSYDKLSQKRGMTEQEWNDMHNILQLSFVVDPAKRITTEGILNKYSEYR